MESEKVLVKPVGGSHDLYTYSIASLRLQENSVALAHSFTEDYGISFISPITIIIAGGYNPSTNVIVPFTFRINLVSLESQQLCPLPVSLKGLRLVCVNQEVFSIGGCTEQNEDYELEGYCFKYNVDRDVWVRLAEMPFPCVFPGVFFKDCQIWATGGLTKTQAITVLDKIRIYHINNNTWELLNIKLLRPSYLHGCALLNDKVLIFGGLRDQMSNRFSYFLGEESRKILPDKISTSFLDPVLTSSQGVWAFNDELILFKYENDWKIEVVE